MKDAKSIICMKEPEIEQVIQCLLGIRPLEVELYLVLLDAPGFPKDVADRIGKSRSLVQRALQNLVTLGLVSRVPVSRNRGRAYLYRAVPKAESKKVLKCALREWYETVVKSVSEW